MTWQGVIVYIGGCFGTSHEDADFVNVDAAGNLHVWRGDEYVQEYIAGSWEDYRIEGGK